jgi:hypothetical protein
MLILIVIVGLPSLSSFVTRQITASGNTSYRGDVTIITFALKDAYEIVFLNIMVLGVGLEPFGYIRGVSGLRFSSILVSPVNK